MTDLAGTVQQTPQSFKLKGSLVRTVVIGLLIISIVPATIIGLFTYNRAQKVLEEQSSAQLGSITETFIKDLNDTTNLNLVALTEIQKYPYLNNFLPRLLKEQTDPDFIFAQDIFKNYLTDFIQTPTGAKFEMISIFDLSGNLLTSTIPLSSLDFFTNEPIYTNLIGTSKSILVYNPGDLYPGQMVLVTASPLTLKGENAATVVGFSPTTLPIKILQSSRSLLASSKAYLVSTDGNFISDYPGSSSLLVNNLPESQRKMISGHISNSGTGTGFEYLNTANQPVFSYITQAPGLDIAFVLEVPSESVFGEVRSILPSLLLIMLAVLLISSAIVTLSARSFVLPLVDLANKAQGFASGDWSFRAKINRRDELGLLAYSFNKLVDELTGYYRSLETRVEEKTQQLRTATEIAQTAVSSADRNEIYERIPKLLVERLDIPYAAFYVFDKLHNKVSLLVNNCKDESLTLPKKGIQFGAFAESLIGWTCLNKQTRISDDIDLEKTFSDRRGIVSNTKSETTIPVMLSDTMIGIIDLQSDQSGAFDQETVSIINSFANQIAAGIQNIQILESAQFDLRETTSLYQISRQLSQVKSSEEVETNVANFFEQSDLVSIFFKCEKDQVRILTFTDPNITKVDQSLIGFNIPLVKGLQKLRDGNTIILDDLKVNSDLSNLSIYFDKRGCTSLVLIPIFESGELTHLLALGSRDSEPFTNLQIQPYRNFCEIVGTTLERIDLLKQLSLRVQELSAIATVGEAAATATDLQELFDNLYEKIKSNLGDDIGFAVALNDNEHGKVMVPFYYDEEKQDIPSYPYSNDLISQTLVTGNTILHRDANAIGLFSIDSPDIRLLTRSFLGIPLVVGGETVGVIALLQRNDANRFSELNIDILKTLAPQIGTSIRNVELLESQRSAIQAYDKERFLLNSLLKNVPDKIVIKDAEGKIIRVSKSFAESLNISNPESLINQLDPTIPKTDEAYQDPDLQIFETGTPSLGEIDETISKDGKKEWLLTSKIPLVAEDGSINSVLKISRDITDLIETQHVAEHRSEQLVIASDIARETSMGSLQLDEMLSKMVNLVKSRFGFYHSSIFLLDPIGQYAILRESTGEAGAKMKSAGHKLAVGSSSIVGQTTSRVEPVVVNDVTKEKNYYPNPLLPETRSELAIPLKVGNKLIGALDVQSRQVNAFTLEDINILQIMADQLSVAIENADLYDRTQKTLERHRLLHQVTVTAGQSITIEDAIRNAVQTVHLAMPTNQVAFITSDHREDGLLMSHAGYSISEINNLRLKLNDSLFGTVIKSKKPIRIEDTHKTKTTNPIGLSARSILSVPVMYGNKFYGVINVESNEPGSFDESDQEIITTLANNLSSIIANIELVDQISLQVERQQQLYEITGKIRRSVDLETIMQTSLSEICNALNIRRGSIQLVSQSQTESTILDNKDEKEFGK